MTELAKAIAQAIAKQCNEVESQRGEEFLVEYVLQGSAIIRKGFDSEAIVNAAVPYDKLLAVALSKLNGVTVESIVREALSGEVLTEDIKVQAQEAIDKFKGQSKKVVSGRTTIKAQVLQTAEIQVCPNC